MTDLRLSNKENGGNTIWERFHGCEPNERHNEKNIAVGDIYKILIPQEFGGGFIRDEYCGSGIVFGDDWDHMADLYGILA